MHNFIPVQESNHKEYRVSLGMRVIISVGALFLCCIGIFIIIFPFIANSKDNIALQVILSLCGIFLIVVGVLGFLDTLKARLIILTDRIILIGFRKKKEIELKDVEGYRILGNGVLVIVPKDKKNKEIKFSNIFENSKEIIEWFDKNLKNLTLEEYKAEEEKILSNVEISYSEEDRREKLEKARKMVRWSNYVIYLIIFWVYVYPYPSQLIYLSLIIIPLLGIYFLYKYKGIVTVFSGARNASPGLQAFLFLPSIMLEVRATLDWNILSYENVWFQAITVMLITTLSILNALREQKKQAAVVIALVLLLGAYGYGFSIIANGIFDDSTPEIYKAKFINKVISDGDAKHYKFKLSRWSQNNNKCIVSVSPIVYNKHFIGDTAIVYLYKGAFLIPWIKLE